MTFISTTGKKEFHSDFSFSNREEKSRYVWEKYSSILCGKVLDVGADRAFLSKHLPSGTEYCTAGLEKDHTYILNLENPLPIENKTFDCVICLDVLEHLENIHLMFDELCRVSSKYVVISLPNPWRSFMDMLGDGFYSEGKSMKFYNLSSEKPEDRHRWFYPPSEAMEFVDARSRKNGFSVLQFDQHVGKAIKVAKVLNAILRLMKKSLHPDIRLEDLFGSTMWWVLERD